MERIEDEALVYVAVHYRPEIDAYLETINALLEDVPLQTRLEVSARIADIGATNLLAGICYATDKFTGVL